MSKRLLGMCSAVLSSLMALSAAAAPVTVSLPATKDNTLYEDPAGSLSDGVGPHIFAGKTGSGAIRRGLLEFDVSSIPSGATITSVTLTMNVSKTSSGPVNVELHRVSRNWGEGTSNAGDPGGGGAFATTGDATWIHTFFNTQTWTTPGGDFDPSASATSLMSSFGSQTWSGPTLVSDVQNWLRVPGSNFGWEVIGNEAASSSAYRFDSRNNADSSVQPSLSVTYTVPEPAALGLIVLLPLLARRSR